MVLLQLALVDPAQQADCADRMLVHRIMVVHIELHLRDDAAEIGHEAAEDARLVHPAQHQFGIAGRRQHIEEEGVGARIAAVPVDQLGIALGRAHRERVNLDAVQVGELEDLDQPHRVFGEIVVAGQREASAIEDEAVQLARTAPDRRQAEPAPARREPLVQVREEHAGQVADGARLQEVILHEPLDRGFARPVGKAHPRRHFALDVEGQAILRAAGDTVQVAAHGLQEIVGAVEELILFRRQQADADEIRAALHVVDIFADPEERMQIAQATLALLDVGFDDVARVAHLAMARVAFGELVGDELALGAVLHLRLEAPRRLVIQRLVADDVARL